MSYSVDCFKKYEHKSDGNYVDVQFEDWDSTDWSASTCVKLQNAMKSIGEGELLDVLLPTFYDIHCLTKDEFYKFKTHRSPEECLEVFKEKDILNTIEEKQPELLHYFQFLVNRWNEGYYVVLTY